MEPIYTTSFDLYDVVTCNDEAELKRYEKVELKVRLNKKIKLWE